MDNRQHNLNQPAVGVIGGSGLYDLPGMENIEEIEIETPFGNPSDSIVRGDFHGKSVFFLPRHGRGHRIAPHEINHRANLCALRMCGVRWLISVAAVGSLREELRPRDIVLPDQIFDRTSTRASHTFFGNGIVAHVSFGDPFSESLRSLLAAACTRLGKPFHGSGTYVNMDGPAFSTRAESETNRALGFHIIGMTNLPEVKLAREAGIACATLAMVTDYDSWRKSDAPVTTAEIFEHVRHNIETSREVLAEVLPTIPSTPNWPEHSSLDGAIVTPRELWPEKTEQALRFLLPER